MRFTKLLTLLSMAVTTVSAEPTYLKQGWDEQQRQEFYNTAQGSQLIPYKWFLELEQADANVPFRDPQNMRRYGFLTSEPSQQNPDGIPIGFVQDDEGEGQSWIGLTCAACHTHKMEYQGRTIRIDGGAAQIDAQSFLGELDEALWATCADPAKLKRFATNVGRNGTDLDSFQQEVKQIADAVHCMVERNKARHPYGFGRLDAFGAILNAVCDAALHDCRNRREASAPVSYPSLWNTPDLAWVQWAATADSPEARNVGQVLGVFGRFNLDEGDGQFESSVRLKNMIKLEHDLLAELFGEGRIMKFRAAPLKRDDAAPDVDDGDYLRTALIKRLAKEAVEFEFALQVRGRDQLDIATDIEDASTVWPDEFVTGAADDSQTGNRFDGAV